MEPEELLFNQPPVAIDNVKRDRIYSVVASGKSKQYLGKSLSIEDAQKLTDEEVERLHERYSSLLGSKLVKSLGQVIVKLYSSTVSKYLPLDVEKLSNELSDNPIVTNALGSYSCFLHYKFGHLLAPVAVALITFNNLNSVPIINNGAESRVEPAGENSDKTKKSGESSSRKESSEIERS
jgi:hypothetical protein